MSSERAGSITDLAASRKKSKYSVLLQNYVFVPITIAKDLLFNRWRYLFARNRFINFLNIRA